MAPLHRQQKMTMKFILIILLFILQQTLSAQIETKNEINYIVSSRDADDYHLIELGNTPKLCSLMKTHEQFLQYEALLNRHAQQDYYTDRKLFEFEIGEHNIIKSIRLLNDSEYKDHKQLQPAYFIGVAAVSASDEPEKLYDSALTLFNNNHVEAAMTTINKAIVINTQNPEYHHLKALCLGNLGKYRQSTDEAMYALEMDGANASLFEIIANNHYFQKDYDKATTYYEKAIEYDLNPYTARIYHNYIKHLIEIPNPRRGTEVYELYLYRVDGLTASAGGDDTFASDLDFYGGQAYQQLGYDDTAMKIYNRLIVMIPNVTGYYAQRGWLNQTRQDWEAAIEDFEKSIELDSGHYYLYANIAQIHQETKDYKKAEAAYKKYFYFDPGDETQKGNYAYLLLDDARHKEAQAIFENLLKTSDPNIDVQIGLILAYHFLSNTKKKDKLIDQTKSTFTAIPINASTLLELMKTGQYYYSETLLAAWKTIFIK